MEGIIEEEANDIVSIAVSGNFRKRIVGDAASATPRQNVVLTTPDFLAETAEVRVARSRGMRGLVIKDHNEPASPLACHLRQAILGLVLHGGFVMNLPNGGINPAGVELMATQIKGEPGRIVWMLSRRWGEKRCASRRTQTGPS